MSTGFRRPELEAPPEIYYNDTTADRYHINNRVREIQRKMTVRAIELLQLPQPSPSTSHSCHILDLGCGTGLSGEVLAEQGHTWVGMDISESMLNVCKRDEEIAETEDEEVFFGQLPDSKESDEYENDDDEDDSNNGELLSSPIANRWKEVILGDMGQGIPFRPGSFDGAISISAVQWLCNIDQKGHIPQKRLRELFQTLYNSLRRGARAVLQFYPENSRQIDMITQAAMKCGFGGGMVVDFPHSTKAKKYFLVIYAGTTGGSDGYRPPETVIVGEGIMRARLQEIAGSNLEDWHDDDYLTEEEEETETIKGEMINSSSKKDRLRVGTRTSRNKHMMAAAARRKRTNSKKKKAGVVGGVRPVAGTKDWVLMKKNVRRARGLHTTPDSKYTLRKRKPKF